MNNPLNEIRSIAMKNKRKLSQKLSTVDRELSDCYHTIERSNYNACQGYQAYVQLKEVLQNRRKVKQEMSTYDKLLGCLGTQA